MDSQENTETVWLTDGPEPKLERVVGVTRVSEIDPEFRQFFTRQSLASGGLLHQEYRSVKTVLKVSRKEIGNVEAADLQARLSISSDAQLKVVEELEQDDKFAFI